MQTQVLAFDVFGTVVDWHGSIVREVVALYPQVDADELALAWRAGYQPAMEAVRSGGRGFVRLDVLHREILDGLLPQFGLQHLDDAGREHLVWNVFAAPAESVELINWCFPIAGCVSYRGYFSQHAAQRYANKLIQQGFDVYVGGVDAYSTLGWFNDPLPSTVLNRSDTQLAGLIFHELAHQRIYLPGDTRFNESFASFVEREGLRRWLEHSGQVELYERAITSLEVQQRFAQFIGVYREELRNLYAQAGTADEKQSGKAMLISKLRSDWSQGQDADYYTSWFAGEINNAKLATVAAYFDWVPAFEQLFIDSEQNFEEFLARVDVMTRLSESERQQQLSALQSVRLQGDNQLLANVSW
jgi:predicted aminopeptidase